jgi:hypothetical protein
MIHVPFQRRKSRQQDERSAVDGGEAGFDQNGVPNILLAHDPSLSTKGAGGSCGS